MTSATRQQTDRLGRPLVSLRLSVTDCCNLRCQYCMPEPSYTWLPREALLSFEEMTRLARIFVRLGVRKLRITGGEPLLRRDLPVLVEALAAIPGLEELTLTTNGTRLKELARPLRKAGLTRLTVSLDTLRPERFVALTRRDCLDSVLVGLAAAEAAGFRNTKLNAVVMRGFNDDEIEDLLELGQRMHLEVRFIEYMDVGGATQWSPSAVISRDEILARVAARFGEPRALASWGAAPAQRYALADGTTFGVIASTTAPFCRRCDRARLTADGTLYLCLYATSGVDLMRLVRGGASDELIEQQVAHAWGRRAERGAELRAGLHARGPLLAPAELRRDVRLEMHTRGG